MILLFTLQTFRTGKLGGLICIYNFLHRPLRRNLEELEGRKQALEVT